MDFSLKNLQDQIKSLKVGDEFELGYDAFGDLFPPGVDSDLAKDRAYKFAEENGCIIENRQDEEFICFVKKAT